MRKGSHRKARILSLSLSADGLPVCDVMDSQGNVYRECQIAALSAGPQSLDYAPPLPSTDDDNPQNPDGSSVLLLFGDGSRPRPVILGGLPSTDASHRFSKDSTAPDDEGTDYPSVNHPSDRVIERAGARLLLSHTGDLVLETAASKRPVHIQLSPKGFLRVAQGGDSSERLVLQGPLVDYMGGLVDKLNDLGAKVQVLWDMMAAGTFSSAAVAGGAAKAAALAAGSPPQAASQAQRAAYSGALTADDPTNAAKLAVPFAYVDEPKPGDKLASSAIRVSKRSKADENG
uniref:Uncharacterized protein n=1 Tax=uncultured Caudovirales phage TaxID=2100421 RepID=A0A6J5L7C1_9CAUD|nr:hypothetical protein UFOVP114_46 [uncultured Caudovirales phage]